LAVPGFIGGGLFAALLLITNRGRTFDEIVPLHFAIWGVVTGIVLGLLTIPAEIGDISPGPLRMTGILTALSLVAALGSAFFFRVVARWQTPATTPKPQTSGNVHLDLAKRNRLNLPAGRRNLFKE